MNAKPRVEDRQLLRRDSASTLSREEKDEHEHSGRGYRGRSFLNLGLLMTIAISLGVNIVLLSHLEIALAGRSRRSYPSIKLPYSPADEVRSYQLKSMDTHDAQSPFGGPPDEDFDRAWSELLWPTSIRVMPHELLKANKQSLKLRDDDGFLGYLEVYHQLHCVKRMVQIRWPERYPELAAQGKLSEAHFNHCIEVLRKGIMCNADTSLNTFTWDQTNSTKMVGISDAPRKCTNWQRLDGWARSRALGPHYQVLSADEDGFLGPVS